MGELAGLIYSLVPWLKALHIIAVIAWMAGLLYLPRLFVYHADAIVPETRATFQIMERRLLKVIMTPAMIVTWLAGLSLTLASWSSLVVSSWFYLKLLLVIALTGFHGVLARWHRLFDRNAHSARFYRFMNEVPTLLMIFIVILVVVRPF